MSEPQATEDPQAAETDKATQETSAPQSAALPPALPPRAQEPDPRYALPAAPRQGPPQARMPFLAAFFSLFPGLGNVYNGLYLRGITFFAICVGLIGLAAQARGEEPILILSVIFVWLFNIFDAYRQATLINYGYAPELEPPDKPRISAWGSGGMVAGVVVFVIGLYGFLVQHFDIDLDLLTDNWTVLLMAFGIFLFVRAVRDRKQREDDLADGSEDL